MKCWSAARSLSPPLETKLGEGDSSEALVGLVGCEGVVMGDQMVEEGCIPMMVMPAFCAAAMMAGL